MFNYLFRFDPWSFLNALRNKAKSLGTYYIEGEVIDFGFKLDPTIRLEEDPNKEYESINSVKVCVADKYIITPLSYYLNLKNNLLKSYIFESLVNKLVYSYFIIII